MHFFKFATKIQLFFEICKFFILNFLISIIFCTFAAKLIDMRMNSSNCHWVIPQKLYKYYSINENLYKVIKSGSCWFSRPLDFNDPFDCNLDVSIGNSDEEIMNNIEKSSMLRLLKEELSNRSSEVKGAGERILSKPSFVKKIINEVHKYYINQNIGVYCLSEDPLNILMWSHYANSHKGICLEFDIKRDGFFYNNLLPVQYRKRYPKFELSDYQDEENMMFAMHQQAICTKSILWKYEKEWRVITDDGCGLKKFDKQDITRVIFGANISDNDKKRILSLLKANEYTAIKYCQCQLSEHKYSLEICDI